MMMLEPRKYNFHKYNKNTTKILLPFDLEEEDDDDA